MKKINLFILFLVLIVASFISCKEPVTGVNLDRDLFLAVGQSATLIPTFVPLNAHNQNVTWETSDPNVATVDNGRVTGIAKGKATITVITQDGGRTALCFVSVVQPFEPEMVWVEGGIFTMGCTDEQGGDCTSDENPSHQVTLNSYNIGKYPITQKEWQNIMLKNENFAADELPVTSVSFYEIQTFINILNTVTGKNYRLPTEAEWEYAARGGNKSQRYKYSGGNNINDVAWYFSNSMGRIHPVGKKLSNELKIYDMSGNIAEFVSDWYGVYSNAPQNNPNGPESGVYRLVRGGMYNFPAEYSRITCRMYLKVESLYGVGFRLVHP